LKPRKDRKRLLARDIGIVFKKLVDPHSFKQSVPKDLEMDPSALEPHGSAQHFGT
jgi:hypothetical protein